MNKWLCHRCFYIYDESVGDPGGGVAPGTPWASVPEDWTCPDCAVPKSEFSPLEE